MAAVAIKNLVIGGGVVGLAIGSRLARYGPTVVVEKNPRVGEETSSRNSEVIHGGIYYPKDSLKTQLCIKGKNQLYEECARHSIPYQKMGKWIIAITQDEVEYLQQLKKKGDDLGIPLRFLSAKEREEEPAVKAKEVLLSSSTGIVDSHSLMFFLEKEIEKLDSNVLLNTEVVALEKKAGYYSAMLQPKKEEKYEIEAECVINCGGLHATKVAQLLMPNTPPHYTTYFCKGQYFGYSGTPLVKRLIYPIPEKNLQGLGVHVTLDLAGRMRFGPDTLYINSNSDYSTDESKIDKFQEAASRYLIGLDKSKLYSDYAGIRPKLSNAGEPARDFFIKEESENGFPGFVNLLGIESPGLTASLAIADFVAGLLNQTNKI